MGMLGYEDTPIIKGSIYCVHDPQRPLPPVVTPSDEIGNSPSDATVLFDGKNLSKWSSVSGGLAYDPTNVLKINGKANWNVIDNYMEVSPGTGDIQSNIHFGDVQYHLEFACPAEIKGESQGRGNSGVFIMGLYEIQVLDGFENPTYADGITAAVYGEHPPLVNACREPGAWQSYDILWNAPRFDGIDLVKPAIVTVIHNGIVVHNNLEIIGPTGHRDVYPYKAHPTKGPLRLQDHGDLVRFRNIWARPIGSYDEG
tara:strand:- start:3711 stop:4478 length:768 start_codon:yes stop_codon:yes gene_type:complete